MKTLEEQKTKTLAYKQSELNGLLNVIQLNSRALNIRERSLIDNLQYGLEFKLKELVEKSKMEEIDIKLECFRQCILILKKAKGLDFKYD